MYYINVFCIFRPGYDSFSTLNSNGNSYQHYCIILRFFEGLEESHSIIHNVLTELPAMFF